jgi:hypothetical protein
MKRKQKSITLAGTDEQTKKAKSASNDVTSTPKRRLFSPLPFDIPIAKMVSFSEVRGLNAEHVERLQLTFHAHGINDQNVQLFLNFFVFLFFYFLSLLFNTFL